MIIGKDEGHGKMLFLTHSKIMIGVFWLTQHIVLSPSINYPFTRQETGKKLNMWNLVRYCKGLEATDKICWLVSLIYCHQTLVYLSESPRSLAKNERFLIFIFNLFHESVGWASEKIFFWVMLTRQSKDCRMKITTAIYACLLSHINIE